jgi:large-conductance mechanosensitive channel
LINFIIITLIYYIAKQRVCETVKKKKKENKNKQTKRKQTNKNKLKKIKKIFIRQFGSVFIKKMVMTNN